MSEKQASFVRHNTFFKIFFKSHSDLIYSFSNLNFTNLSNGYSKLLVYYSSYSYYLKDDEYDTFVKDTLLEKFNDIVSNQKYNDLIEKINKVGLSGLSVREIKNINQLYNSILNDMLEILVMFNNYFSPSDLLPKLTDNASENERNIAYVIYDAFYDSLFNLHNKITELLLNYNLIDFNEILKMIKVFFYGYSYYLQKDTIKTIKDEIKSVEEYCEKEEFIETYYNVLLGRYNNTILNNAQTYTRELFNRYLNIFDLINGDLPKTNLMPRKKEKILVDNTLI